MLAFKARKETIIAAPSATLFAIVSDLERHPELAGSGEVLRPRLLTPGPIGVGTRFEADEDIRMGRRRLQFAAPATVVVSDPPAVFSWVPEPPGPPKVRRIQWWFHLSPQADGTRVVHAVEVDLNPVMNVLFKLPYRLLRGRRVARGMARTLENLRQLAEPRIATTR